MADHLCPSCGICLSVGHLGTAPLDLCTVCGGVWLDVLALRELLYSSPSVLRGVFRKVRCNAAPLDHPVAPGACPYCSVPMDKIALPDVFNAPIYTCNPCRGFWLTGATLEQLSNATEDPEPLSGSLAGIPDPHACSECGDQNPDPAAC